MLIVFHFSADNHPDLLAEIEKEAKEIGLNPTRPVRMRTGSLPIEIIVALGSAGAFTALFQLISNLLSKNKDRELTITIPSEEKTLTLKGHSLPEEKELIKRLAPMFAEEKAKMPDRSSPKGHKSKRERKP